MRRQILWAHAIICAVTLTTAIPAAAHAGHNQPPAHAQSDKDKNKDKNKKNKKEKGEPHGQARGHDPQHWNPLFRGLDKNDNGVVSRSEWNGDDRSFANHDWNRDGVLSGEELVAGATRPDTARREPDRRDADRNDADRKDTDRKDSARDRDRRGNEPDEVLFARMDSNRDNSLSRSEWTGTASDFERLDFNKDGVLSPYEFGVGR